MWWERKSTAPTPTLAPTTATTTTTTNRPTEHSRAAQPTSAEQSSCRNVYEFRIGKVNFVRQFWCCCAICNDADCTATLEPTAVAKFKSHTHTKFLGREATVKKSLSSHHFEWAQQQLTPQQQKEREREIERERNATEVAAATLTSTLFLISAAAGASKRGTETRIAAVWPEKFFWTLRALAFVCVCVCAW